ncbi:MAG: PQQ-dependent sugar dehydrogenase [Opitutales bacterium]|nr:PQQ-dependent sugar dehydrogenase [Opitutales bacterium]
MRHFTLLVLLAASAAVPSTASAGDDALRHGRNLHLQYCVHCHGDNSEGGWASSLFDGSWAFGDTRRYIRRNIEDGISERGMPGYKRVLDSEDIDRLMEYITHREAQETSEGDRREGPDGGPRAVPGELGTLEYTFAAEVFAEGLEIPWGIAFPDADTALITERPGPLRVVRGGGLLPDPVEGTPEVLHQGQGGMMEVAVDPDYADNGWIYLGYTHAIDGEGRPLAMTRIMRGRIEEHRWVDEELVYEAPRETYLPTRHHYGVRIVFDHDGYLYFAIGDRGIMEHAQDLGRPNGKIHRVHRDGRIPEDNPFVAMEGALPTIYSYGHRNPQGLAVHPETGRLWSAEHGPRGGDALHLISAGRNYGWPVISYGINYDGSVITHRTSHPGMEQPIYYWTPSIAVCGLDFYRGDLFPRWRNRLLASALRFEEVQLLNVYEERVMHAEVILKGYGRVRTAVTGPDGAVYVVQNSPGRVLRLTPKASPFAE